MNGAAASEGLMSNAQPLGQPWEIIWPLGMLMKLYGYDLGLKAGIWVKKLGYGLES